MSDHNVYQSPFSWRYASAEMRQIWSEVNKRRLWRKIWVALARVQHEYGLVDSKQVADLEAQQDRIDIQRALEIEAEFHHDLMAEVKTYAEQCPIGGGIIHLGATSMDVKDNAEVMQLKQALQVISVRLSGVLNKLADLISKYADLPVIAFTHLQPAEPTTLGYRLSFYAQDLLEDWLAIQQTMLNLRAKGFKGAVGTSASYIELVGSDRINDFEERLSSQLQIPFFLVTHQTYPRRQDYQIISTLAGLGATLYKFSFDLRLLQSRPFGELEEPFGSRQVGSSAMPFKRNPISAEKISSLARSLSQMPALAWQNMAHSLLERTLDDSANRRTLLPEAFLICDEILDAADRILTGLSVNTHAIAANLKTYAPFANTEKLLMRLARAGADRQEMHERIRTHAMAAWDSIQGGGINNLPERIKRDEALLSYLPLQQIEDLMAAEGYIGCAPDRARQMAAIIGQTLDNPPTG